MTAHDGSIPHLRPSRTSKQLYVHGKPFLVRGAELQNSSFSSIQHMEPIWDKMKRMHVNTILGNVTWEAVEPIEGQFDFALVDELILKARQHQLKLVLLWFGAWKNGYSTYAPSWVKLDPLRFPRAESRQCSGRPKVTEILSAVHGEAVEADSKAFAAFMKHLKAVDINHSTVIMVQVENEVGMLGDSRDCSEAATQIFHENVPYELVDFLNTGAETFHPDLQRMLRERPGPIKSGASWPDTFGNSVHTDEMFMAFHYAKCVDRIAQTGAALYPLPMFANFWLNYADDPFARNHPTLAGGGSDPGDYPSGGAVSHVLDIWMHFAPNLAFVSPDTYLNDYHRICSTYRHRNQPLFIPEQRRDEYGARRVWAAVGQYLALGACPFALDTVEVKDCAYTKHYCLLEKVQSYVLAAQQQPESIIGFFLDEPEHMEASTVPPPCVEMGGFEVRVERAFTTGSPGPGYGLVIHLGTNKNGSGKFLLVGAGFQVKWRSLVPCSRFTGILSLRETDIDPSSGELSSLRWLNGDETRSGHQAIMPNEAPDDGGFPISINIPAVTKIAVCTVYSI